MSENRVIGDRGKIPWRLPEDFRWFRHKTMGGTLVMGRKTFDSIGKPLPGRETVVLSRGVIAPGTTQVRNLEELESLLPGLPAPYWICGGAEIYQQMLPRCTHLYLTRVKFVVEGDAFFPEFETVFALDQVIHENDRFRVERWSRQGDDTPPDVWPFA